MNDNNRVDKYRDSIEGVERVRRAFMVEPSGDERQCCMEEMCEGKFIPQVPNGFIIREFLLPSQQKPMRKQKGTQYKGLRVYSVKDCRLPGF